MPAMQWWAQPGRVLVGRLESGSDLVGEIERLCGEHGIGAAWVSCLGAVRRARYAYYEQHDHRYLELETDTHHEIAGFSGNVSMRDGRPFLHAHASFADASGATVSGHLLPGIEVFAAELLITELTGVELVRRPDADTGLALW
jgi:predicted DNA-binding protein with PD1-like motif